MANIEKRSVQRKVNNIPSGSVITSIASLVNRGTLYCFAAASALDMVGLEIMTGVTPGALVIASKCTNPIRPIPCCILQLVVV
jgi:hypothetical protein